MVKDTRRFAEDAEYREGSLAGEAEGIQMQKDANAAVGASQAYKIQKEVEKSQPDAVARDAVKDADSTTLENLYK